MKGEATILPEGVQPYSALAFYLQLSAEASSDEEVQGQAQAPIVATSKEGTGAAHSRAAKNFKPRSPSKQGLRLDSAPSLPTSAAGNRATNLQSGCRKRPNATVSPNNDGARDVPRPRKASKKNRKQQEVKPLQPPTEEGLKRAVEAIGGLSAAARCVSSVYSPTQS